MPKLTRTDDELHLALSGATDFQAALAAVKSVSGRRFDPESKLWKFPARPELAERLLLTVKPTADPSILAWVRASRAEREQELATQLPDDGKLLIPWAGNLYDFQRAAVAFMAEHNCVILADDMGLGKTLQALAAVREAALRKAELDLTRPKLIVCPNSAKGVWGREIAKWLGTAEPFQLVDAKVAKKRQAQIEQGIKDGGWVVVNYEQIRAQRHEKEVIVNHRDGSCSTRIEKWYDLKQPLFAETDWLAVIADEAHRAKNRKAAQTIGLWSIDAPIKFALTGTPLMNSPDELWSLLKWLYPEQYGKSDPPRGTKPGHHRTAFWAFHDQYTESYEGYGGGRIVIGVKNPDGLRFELKDRLIRRTKAQKLNIPEKTREHIPVKLNAGQQKVYDEAEGAFWLQVTQAISEGDKAAAKFAKEVLEGKKRIFEISNGASRTVRLRQVCSTPALLGGEDDSAKFDAIVDNVLDNSHQQHVVFTEFVESSNLLVARLRKKGVEAEAFTGEVTDTRIRTFYEDKFQSGNIDVLCGTLGAMRESITLTAANIVHFSERAWVPGWNEQAEDRLHRTGQVNPVTILIYEGIDTVDTQKVRPTNALKEIIVSSVIHKDQIQEKEIIV